MALSSVVSEIFNVEKCRDLEIQVQVHSKSSKVVPFEMSTVTLSLSCSVFEIFDL